MLSGLKPMNRHGITLLLLTMLSTGHVVADTVYRSVDSQGRVIYSDTPWALTSISQLQFWDDFKIEQYGDGTVQSVLSIDISDWDTPGLLYGKAARECTKEEIKEEVWAQLTKSLADDPLIDLHDDMIVDWYLDRDIVFDATSPTIPPSGDGCPPDAQPTSDFTTQNTEQLLVKTIEQAP